jgi:hypothetical protein
MFASKLRNLGAAVGVVGRAKVSRGLNSGALADAGVLADPQHKVRWVAGQVDDLVLRQAGNRWWDHQREPTAEGFVAVGVQIAG